MHARRMMGNRGVQLVVAAAVLAIAVVALAPRASARTLSCTCGPYTPPLTSTGAGTAVQSVTITPPVGGSVQLLDNVGNPVTTWSDPAGAGTYTFDAATTTISFAPALGFIGSPDPSNVALYEQTDQWNVSRTNTYTPTVTLPAPPAAPAQASTGTPRTAQTVSLVVPAGGTASLLDGSGNPVTSFAVAGQGTYTVNPTTGVVTFSPVDVFSGDATPVGYRVTDAYAQHTDGTVTVHVLAAELEAPTTAPVPTTTTTSTTPRTASTPSTVSAGTLPTTGSATLPLVAGGALLVLGGAALVVVARRQTLR